MHLKTVKVRAGLTIQAEPYHPIHAECELEIDYNPETDKPEDIKVAYAGQLQQHLKDSLEQAFAVYQEALGKNDVADESELEENGHGDAMEIRSDDVLELFGRPAEGDPTGKALMKYIGASVFSEVFNTVGVFVNNHGRIPSDVIDVTPPSGGNHGGKRK